MQILFHPDAQEELNRATSHYESNEPGLGYQFAIEIFAAVERIKAYPGMWPIWTIRFAVAWFTASPMA
jgi:hypothetical protein